MKGRKLRGTRQQCNVTSTQERKNTSTQERKNTSTQERKNTSTQERNNSNTKTSQNNDNSKCRNCIKPNQKVTPKEKVTNSRKSKNNDNLKRKPDKNGEKFHQTSKRMEDSNIFPPNIQWIIFIITLVFRIHYVCQKKNWWILHPDEIYQSLEVAHSEIYGYGFRPYEYLPPYNRYSTNATVAMQHEYRLGMYSLRSPLFPKIFVYVGYVFISFGYTGNLFVVWKCFHAAVSSTLVLAVYSFTRVIYNSHDKAVISCMLSASSLYLKIFGTHTLINSFLSPFIFFILAHILKCGENLNCIDGKRNDRKVVKMRTTDGNTLIYDQSHTKSKLPDTLSYQAIDHNANLVDRSSQKSDLVPQGIHVKHIQVKPILFGFTTGLLIYLRPDSSIIMTVTMIVIVGPLSILNRSWLSFIIGIMFAFCVGIKEDYDNYGPFIISPWQWIRFNVIGLSSSHLFGFEPNLFYLKHLVFEDNLNMILLVLTSYYMLPYIWRAKYLHSETETLKIKTTLQLCAISVLTVLMYSLKGHKEARFMHDVIPIVLGVFSEALFMFCRNLSSYFQIGQRYFLISSLILIMSSEMYKFATLSKSNISKLTYNKITSTNDVNICLDFIGQQTDVTGLFLETSIHMSGAYTIINQNIPIVALSHKEFLKFGMDARETMQSLTTKGRNVSIFTFNHIADFISVKNSLYLLSVLIAEPKFNYLVVKEGRQFVNRGFVEVFRYGTMKVLKRASDRCDGDCLLAVKNQTTITNNQRLLNAEADWLIYYGAYDLAADRLRMSLGIDERNVLSNQLLIQLFHLWGENKLARRALVKCMKHHNKTTCLLSPNHEHKF